MVEIKKHEPLWGAWFVDSQIGEGSFGKVYKVFKEDFGNTYYSAVKMISIPQNEADFRQMRSEGMDDGSIRSYFHTFVSNMVAEINIMSEFKGHSHIVSLEDHKVIEKSDSIGWDILIRMELLKSLAEHVENNPANKPLTHDEVIKLGMDICRALEVCGKKNTIHRDIKPDNIFVSQYGDFKLGDFGIARQIEKTVSGMSKKGTYTYMSPEVFNGQNYGASVDIYSLGIVMYRLLNQSRTPFLPSYPEPITPNARDEALMRRMKGEPLPSIKGVAPSLNAIILKACEFDHNKRFASASEMKKALASLSGDRTVMLDFSGKAEAKPVANEYDADIAKSPAEPTPAGGYAPEPIPAGGYAPIAPHEPSNDSLGPKPYVQANVDFMFPEPAAASGSKFSAVFANRSGGLAVALITATVLIIFVVIAYFVMTTGVDFVPDLPQAEEPVAAQAPLIPEPANNNIALIAAVLVGVFLCVGGFVLLIVVLLRKRRTAHQGYMGPNMMSVLKCSCGQPYPPGSETCPSCQKTDLFNWD